MSSSLAIASADFQCTYINDNEQYLTDLMCATSDLIQRYSGTPANPVIPNEYNFEVIKPVLQVLFSSANAGMTEVVLKSKMLSQEWYINNQKIVFPPVADANGKYLSPKVGNFDSGTFNQIQPGGTDYPFGGIQFLKNMVTPLGGANGVLRCVLKFRDNSDNVITKEHTCIIGARQFSSDGYEVDIYTEGSTVLTLTNPTVLLHARLWKGPDKVFDSKTSTAKTVRWYTYDDTIGDWSIVQNATNSDGETIFFTDSRHELTVGRDGVPTYLIVRAAIFNDASETDYSKAEATGTIRVNDQTDTLFIQPNATPEDRVLRAGESTPDGITFAPKVYDKKSSGLFPGTVLFRFICYSPAGTILNGTAAQGTVSGVQVPGSGYDSPTHGVVGVPDNTELLATYKVPRAMMESVGDVRVLINAYKQ